MSKPAVCRRMACNSVIDGAMIYRIWDAPAKLGKGYNNYCVKCGRAIVEANPTLRFERIRPILTAKQKAEEALAIAKQSATWADAVGEIVRRGLASTLSDADELIREGEDYEEANLQ